MQESYGYDFAVPLLAGDHVTDDTGTGFVHTAPGHGREDFEVWTANARRSLRQRRHQHDDPLHGRCRRALHRAGAGLHRQARPHRKGEKGDANEAVIKALVDAGMLIARGKLKHQYPHSWRSKKPVIFRNTPQWFIAMDKPIADFDVIRTPRSGGTEIDTPQRWDDGFRSSRLRRAPE